jgi:hypothetical protein
VQAQTAGDPLTGSWGHDGVPMLELKLDGKSDVTGTAIWRGDGMELRTPIRTGTFDPAKGAFKLEGEGRTPGMDAPSAFVIEGSVTGESMTGRFTFGDRAGDFTFTRLQQPSGGTRTPEQMTALLQAHKGDFDYLLGDWEFTAKHKEFGEFRGLWSAVQLSEGQILDEYRVVDDKGGTIYVTASLRNYNKAMDRWELIGSEAGNGLLDFGTAQRVGSEVRIEQKFGVASGTPHTMKIRYYNIQPDRFSWTADRSSDDGKTWEKDYEQIEARRIGPARTLPPLTTVRKLP